VSSTRNVTVNKNSLILKILCVLLISSSATRLGIFDKTAATSSAKRKTCPTRCPQDDDESIDNSDSGWRKYLRLEDPDDDDHVSDGGHAARASVVRRDTAAGSDLTTECRRSNDETGNGEDRTVSGPRSMSRDSSNSAVWTAAETERQNDRNAWLVFVFIVHGGPKKLYIFQHTIVDKMKRISPVYS